MKYFLLCFKLFILFYSNMFRTTRPELGLQMLHQLMNLQDVDLMKKISLEFSNALIKLSYIRHASIFHGLLPWPMNFPKIQSAGYPWSYRKIEEGMLLLKLTGKGREILNDAAKTYLDQKRNTPNPTVQTEEEQIPENNDGEPTSVEEQAQQDDAVEEQVVVEDHAQAANLLEHEQDEADNDQQSDVPQGEVPPLSCICPFKSLIAYLSNDNIGVEHLKKIESGCVDIIMGDLHSIITNYRSFFESCIYIAKDIHMDEAAAQIRRILDGIPDKLDQIATRPTRRINDPLIELNASLERLLSQAPSNN